MPDHPENGAADRGSRDLRSFGRRRARRLTARQQHLFATIWPSTALSLAQPAPNDPCELFGGQVREVWLEIGFGGGEHLVWQARHNRDVGIIGCEPFVDGTAKVLDAIDSEALSNVRLYDDDARDVLRWLQPASVARAFVLFPDPWPKKRHNKRRLINAETCRLLARAMRARAQLRLATDIADYASAMLLAMRADDRFVWQADGPRDWRERSEDWPETRYERKARKEGRRCYYFRFARR